MMHTLKVKCRSPINFPLSGTECLVSNSPCSSIMAHSGHSPLSPGLQNTHTQMNTITITYSYLNMCKPTSHFYTDCNEVYQNTKSGTETMMPKSNGMHCSTM